MFGWNKPQLRKAQNSAFHAGETWEYQNRPHENDSTFRVWRVETLPDGTNVVHIQVQGLKISDSQTPGDLTEVVEHLPIFETALSESATRRVSIGEALALPEGYEEWRIEWERGRAEVFSLPLADVLSALEQKAEKPGE